MNKYTITFLATFFFSTTLVLGLPKNIKVSAVNPSINCEKLVNQFISQKGYKKSALTIETDWHFNTVGKVCLISVHILTPWKNGELEYFLDDVYDITNKRTIATFRAYDADPGPNPSEVTTCVFRGMKDYNCSSQEQYETFVRTAMNG